MKSSSHAALLIEPVGGGAGGDGDAMAAGVDSSTGGLIAKPVKGWLPSERRNDECVSESRVNLDFHTVGLSSAQQATGGLARSIEVRGALDLNGTYGAPGHGWQPPG